MFKTSVIELSKSALKKNFDYLNKLVGKRTKVSSVVKGNAYGHGIEQYVIMADSCGIKHFSVYSADEAFRIFNVLNNKCCIMIMGYADNQAIEWAVESNIEFFVFDLDRLNRAIKTAEKVKKKAKVHLEVETGMNRTGFNREDLKKAIAQIKKNNRRIELCGVCTHYAGAESVANYYRIQKQRENFNQHCQVLQEAGLKPKYRHTASSAAAISYPETRMDLVRIGILQYGFWPSQETYIDHLRNKKNKFTNPLESVLSWKSKIMSTKHVKRGEFIGYGNHFLTQKPTRIAVVPVGYSHGFSRSLSNQARVLVHGQRADVIGIVNMNLIIIDITDISQARRGSEVVLIGRQGDSVISVSSFSEITDQLNYELLTRLPIDTPRKIVD